jgi:hypothetical protein
MRVLQRSNTGGDTALPYPGFMASGGMTTLFLVLGAFLVLGLGIGALHRYRPSAVPILLSIVGWLSAGLGTLALVGFVFTGLLPLLAGILLFVVPVAVWLAGRLSLDTLPASGVAPQAERGGVREVNTAFLAVSIDRERGVIEGWVVKGSQAGHTLDELDRPALQALRAECAADPPSARLLTLYLERQPADRRPPDDAPASGPPRDRVHDTDMSVEEAWRVLGLAPGAAPDEIRTAHRRLMRDVHPDRGGSDATAARVNRAKDLLLDRDTLFR